MIEHLHDHAVSELQQSARSDTVFVVTAVLFNLVVLGINWGQASGKHEAAQVVIFAVLIAATLLINAFAIQALSNGRRTRLTLIGGLVQMYKDSGVDKYYNPELLKAYGARYNMFIAIIVCLAGIAIVVPIIQWAMGK